MGCYKIVYLTMLESDGIEVDFYPLHMRPGHHRLKLVN